VTIAISLTSNFCSRAIMKKALLIGSTSVKRRVTASDRISPFFSARV
jgi:hypothetical protein